MVRRWEPAPEMFAPIFLSMAQRSTISGSHAAPSRVVVPGVNTAAIIALAVPVTVLPWRPPMKRFPAFIAEPSTSTMPWFSEISAPISCSACKCKSMGRCPITHPPGMGTFAFFILATSGPSRQMEARIFRTNSYGGSGWIFSGCIFQLPGPILEISAPKWLMISAINRISLKSGTFSKMVSWSLSNAAANWGRAAFFDPLTSTCPVSWFPPRILSISITHRNGRGKTDLE